MDWVAALRKCFREGRVLYSRHARLEMREEELGPISDQEVGEAIDTAEVIELYPDDTPYASALVGGRTGASRPIHVVCAYDAGDDRAIVVTVYEPDPERWEGDFKTRRA